jgi:small subunit ribosomal protein S17
MRERKKKLVGRVVSDKMDKTVVVAVQSLRPHRLYKRRVRVTKKYMAHDEANECHIGDLVRIQESRPMSRHKRWRVMEILERAAERGKAVELPVAAPEVQELEVMATADVPDEEVITRASGTAPDETGPTPQEEARP